MGYMTELVSSCNKTSSAARITATIAICTCNRVDCLQGAVRSALAQMPPFEYEVLVVDNNSSDGTKELMTNLQREFPELRYCFEGKPGISHARNTALREARGRIVAFIDDDGIAQPGWLENLEAQFDGSSVSVVGGRIELQYPCDRPEWLTESMEYLLSKFDAGTAICDVSEVIGCNFAVDRERTIEMNGFSPICGYTGETLLPGEETEICKRVKQAEGAIIYAPDAVVVHRVHKSRLRQDWFARRIAGGAKAAVRIGACDRKPDKLAREVMWCRLNSLARRLRGERTEAFYWDLETIALSTILSELLGGHRTKIRALRLYWGAIPSAARWAIGISRAMLANKPLHIPPWVSARETTEDRTAGVV